jgi:hypothetical protein
MSIISLDYYGQLLENISGQLDISLSTLRNDIRGVGNRTLTDLFNKLDALDNALASVATDKFRMSIVDPLPAGTNLIGKVAGDQGLALKQVSATDGRLDVYCSFVANPSNLDVALSTRASESTLSSLNGKFPSAVSLGDALSNPTTTIIGSALLGWDGANWRRLAVDSSSRLRAVVESLPALPSGSNIIGGVFADYGYVDTINQQVSTTEVVGSAVDVRRRGGKLIYMNNTQDVSVTVTIEGSYDGVTWFTIRDGITLAAGEKKVGILTDRYGYVRAKAVASAAPTSGSVVITVSSMSW